MRLPGVDAPEIGRPGANEATALAVRFLAAGPFTLEPPDPGRDLYGRLLADARRGAHSLSEELVTAGWAWVYRGDDPRLLARQAEAVADGRGVHRHIDQATAGEVFLVTRGAFHRVGCPTASSRHAVVATATEALARGRSPCRSCLRWPPSDVDPP